MKDRNLVRAVTVLAVTSHSGCTRSAALPVEPPPLATPAEASPPRGEAATQGADAAPLFPPWSPPENSTIDGPHELTLEPGRTIWYARSRAGSRRLIGHLHGVCGPPSYACGKWIGAGTSHGVMVCPTGNSRCGDPSTGPASWDAPSWAELVAIMDRDLEVSVARVAAKPEIGLLRTNAILTGYSRGAYAATAIARSHPNRWPLLVLIEADAPLGAAWLRKAGVKAVAMVAGELGDQIEKERKIVAALTADGFPARLFVMRKTSHPYSDDMEYVMHDALSFVLEHEND